jgi:hypothetical protein
VAGFFAAHRATSAAQMARLVDSGSSKNFALMCFSPFAYSQPFRLLSGSLAVATWYHAKARLSSVEPRNLHFAQKAWNHVV